LSEWEISIYQIFSECNKDPVEAQKVINDGFKDLRNQCNTNEDLLCGKPMEDIPDDIIRKEITDSSAMSCMVWGDPHFNLPTGKTIECEITEDTIFA